MRRLTFYEKKNLAIACAASMIGSVALMNFGVSLGRRTAG